ncbi:hypothetical protein LCGC14_2673880, partial [marine sediment metagenome]
GLKQLDSNSIDCSMSSPPYWALRDYSTEGQLGLEPTFDEYIKKLCDIYDEVKRVLKPSGTCWVNLGDTYGGTGVGQENNMESKGIQTSGQYEDAKEARDLKNKATKGIYDKCLLLIPFRFAIEMINRGWILRNTIIWHKPNCMPSSAKDRFTVDFEYIFFFVKNKKYFFEPQYEEQSPHTLVAFKNGKVPLNPKSILNPNDIKAGKTQQAMRVGDWNAILPFGRNKRTVWSICPQPFPEGVCPICGYYGKPKGKYEKEGYFGGEEKRERFCPNCRNPIVTSHFAIYPEELCQTPLKSGCPEFVCKKCGKRTFSKGKVPKHKCK